MNSFESKLADAKRALAEILDLRAAVALLEWDRETHMPPKGAEARGWQVATLTALAHRLITAPAFGERLAALRGDASLDPDARILVEETAHDYERATRLPESFVERFALAQNAAYHAWVKARAGSSFSVFAPHLEALVGLARERADYLGYAASPYDALLDDFERGMTVATLRPLFAELAERQSVLVRRIAEARDGSSDEWLDQPWDEGAQWDFTVRILKAMGYDFEAGRQDRSVHPFTTSFDVYDVRVTTRFDPRNPFSGLLGSMHEGGHALYEQGFRPSDRRTVLAEAPSLGMHESQSRLWENMVGRSRAFWTFAGPLLRDAFPEQTRHVTQEAINRAINRVEPSLIRVESDECTYNLHIIVRFEIEVDLLEGRLGVTDVPSAWNDKMKAYLGVDVPDDARGCLQDIHWSHGAFGYFPTYALGNLYAAQLSEKIIEDIPSLGDCIAAGEFGALLGWLREHVHRAGRRQTAPRLIAAVTGAPPHAEPYLRYLEAKFGG